jgi:hypothetical protein
MREHEAGYLNAILTSWGISDLERRAFWAEVAFCDMAYNTGKLSALRLWNIWQSSGNMANAAMNRQMTA